MFYGSVHSCKMSIVVADSALFLFGRATSLMILYNFKPTSCASIPLFVQNENWFLLNLFCCVPRLCLVLLYSFFIFYSNYKSFLRVSFRFCAKWFLYRLVVHLFYDVNTSNIGLCNCSPNSHVAAKDVSVCQNWRSVSLSFCSLAKNL